MLSFMLSITFSSIDVHGEQSMHTGSSPEQTSTAYWKYITLAPPAAIRDIIDLPFRVATFPLIGLFEMTDAANVFDPDAEVGMFFYLTFPVSMPGVALVGIDSAMVFWGTDEGFMHGCRKISQPFSYGAGLFPNVRNIDFHPSPQD